MLKRCGICGQPIERYINISGRKQIVGCACKCVLEHEQKMQEKRNLELLNEKRDECFGIHSAYRKWTFDNDDNLNPQLSTAMKRYCELFDEMYKKGQGLLIFGNVGTGKSYYGACICNYLLEHGKTALMTNFASLTNRLQESFEARNNVINEICRYDLVVIDDLGIERNTEYMNEIVFSIIDARYQTGKPFIITTNLSGSDFESKTDLNKSRIYDRIKERCLPVRVDGESRREKKLKETVQDTRKLLGL